MVRGGGLCVAEPPGSPLNRVSPRIRALQDRLLDSLPADGAWECLSPAQREAIISLHRARITRNIDSRGRSPERGKKSGNNGNRNFISKGINKYGRCRSYEDKLESETDDSGVRLLSGETNSSSTSNSHSHEDDSSDPGVKREGRFAKSPRVDRAIQKDGKTPYDVSKRTNVPNGIGNVNKIISKQQSRNPPLQPIACKATLDCRNIMGVKHRTRVSNSNFIFESEQQQMQRMISPDGVKLKICDQSQKSEQISRKNILERYRDPKSREIQNKNRLIVEKYDNRINFRNDNNRLDYDIESDQTPRSDGTSPSFAEENGCFRRGNNNNNRFSRSRHIVDDILIDAFEVDDELFERKEEQKDKDSGLDVSSGKANKALLNSGYDYRTHLNLDAFDKYSSNWNSIILNRSSDVPMRVVCYQDKHPVKIHPVPPTRASRQFSPMNRYSSPAEQSGFNHLRQEQSSYPDRNVGRKYVRSKSLDRKYLDDSSDDESDFEVRRRTERMRRYAKANQDWGLHKQSSNDRRNMEVASRPKAKSNIDLSRINPSSEDFDDTGNNCFQSRSNILNKWKSEDFDLSSKPHEDREFHEDFDRSRWRRRSCDFELETSDGETKKRMKEADRRKWQRRSCDFELEGDQDDFLEKWDATVKNEMRIVKERKTQTHKKELRHMNPTNIKRIEPSLGKCHPMRENATPPLKMPRKKYLKEKEAMISAKPESRIFSPNEDLKVYPRYPIPPGHLLATKPMKCPGVTNGKNKTANAFRDNGVLSFENPNYTLNSGIIDDALNRNTNNSTNSLTTTSKTFTDTQLDGGLAALDSLYTELDHVCNLTRTSSVRNRRHYADLCIGSMGVDVTTGPVTNLDKADHQNNSLVENECMMGRKKGNFTTQPDFIEHTTPQGINSKPQPPQNINQQQALSNQDSTQNAKDPDNAMISPDEDSNDISSSSIIRLKNGVESSPAHQSIPHMTPYDSQDLYALPIKKNLTNEQTDILDFEEKTDLAAEDTLPCGWEKHEDNDGPYYWHIKSGTITRDPPTSATQVETQIAPLRVDKRYKDDQTSSSMTGSVTRSNTSSALSELVETRPRSNAVDNAYKRRSYPARSDFSDSGGGRPIRFAVRSLGWVEIAEEDLTPERSSKAVNRCIVDLSMGGRRDVLDVVGCWGDGKDLFMDLDEGSLKLVDPENLTVLNTQPIHTIRVWGVGRDNGRERDFAYVARDRITRKHMCHVFRCDTPARTIANTLRDICKKIMIERSLQQTMLSKPLDPGQNGGNLGIRVARPTNLPTEHRRLQRHSQLLPSQSFPTPMEEPKKTVRAQYAGSVQVTKPSGIEVLNAAIQTVVDSNPLPWKSVAVSVAPSTITITNMEDDQLLAECRVRFLSFLGIGQNVKECAFIMHTAQDQFIAHVFHCEPSSGALCKIIEAACKLRYQKCLDAHPGGTERGRGETTPKSLTATLKSVFTTIAGRKARSAES